MSERFSIKLVFRSDAGLSWPAPVRRVHALRSPLAFAICALVIGGAAIPQLGRSAYAQGILDDTDALLVAVNVERMRTQLLLTENSFANGDLEMAFAHAYIPHSATFPSIKDRLQRVDAASEGQLESMLSDLPFKIKSGASQESVRADLANIRGLLDHFLESPALAEARDDRTITVQTVIYLVQDAGQSYQLSNAGGSGKDFSKVDYENSLGLVAAAQANYAKVASSLDGSRRAEIDSFFPMLTSGIDSKSDYQAGVSRWIEAIERSLSASVSLSSTEQGAGYAHYFATIRSLLADAVAQVKNGDYEKADDAVVEAYLDNYEYLEAPIGKVDQGLFVDKEIRDDLRQMIHDHRPAPQIESFVNDQILVKLGQSEDALKSDPGYGGSGVPAGSTGGGADVERLKAGFGSYTGEKKQMGEADDSAKTTVRTNIDKIRVKLDDMLQMYGQGNYDGAFATARSAYLDSYEAIEIPLRPINPDFTLDMEIKYAQMRNLIQSHAPYGDVEAIVVDIRKGLDESERLVSGTGVLAPAIAFSTSFSLIFREGLESALIIGAILTYLEASRNERFKKHTYYGIIMAVGATAVTWFAAEFIIQTSGASVAMVEAVAGISAVAVLFWVSFWVLNKIETKKWIEFVKAKVWKATATGSVTVFIMLSFFTVYREGFETVLFYQAMLSFAKYMEWYVVGGLVLGLGIILGVAFVIRKFGKKLPLRVLFGLTMGIGAYMSIAFIGNAIREFQEVGYISTTHMIGIIPRFDINTAAMTGIHPTLETVLAQLALLSVYVAGSMYVLVVRPRKSVSIQAARKSRADLEVKKSGSDAAEKERPI